ncbi:hypothetical protein A3I48_00990 [Candidatus Daviesbacteria bacterium RIFCSPLOWO2_02_FULL_36_7]|uniref:Uncharacterized protein n=1 Tax=Candidatus Daviesbacteria bacterium RIFCSPLOWO2_02_FULL_36_7 TaxID=1797792 RepID=A0A1F5MI74_9BACT|nr:MAG: hypothetical protein A3I48_00990 [Candidatus Daviesbacteria bacterium RIFCSPLOWO2_02_FULL_36_7]
MAIQQTKRQSDLEKRLQLLRKQVYGNEKFRVESKGTVNSSNDLTYLGQDLLKILIFSSAAIGIQLVLFILLKNNILKLNLF